MRLGSGKLVLKIAAWAAAFIVVCIFARSEAVYNALLLFFTLGIVPGTHIALSPNVTFWTLGIIFVLCFVLIFGSNIRRTFQKSGVVEQNAVPKPATAKAPKPVIIIRIPRKQSMFEQRVRSFVAQNMLRLRRSVHYVFAQLRQLYMWLRPIVVLGCVWLARNIRTGAVWLVRCAIRMVRAAWHYTKPRIKQCDAWLRKKCNQSELFRSVRRAFFEIVNDWRTSLRALRRQWDELTKQP